MGSRLTTYSATSIALALLTLSALVTTAHAQAQGQTAVNGGGGALLTDTATGINYPVQFGLSGVVGADGSANGHVNFVFPLPFAGAWGAVPGVDRIHIAGRVTSGEVLGDGTVVLEGTLTERDYTRGQGVVFIEENVPFRIEAGGGLGPQSMRLQWCLLPAFPVAVTGGNLLIR
jgi:hypothetical protein